MGIKKFYISLLIAPILGLTPHLPVANADLQALLPDDVHLSAMGSHAYVLKGSREPFLILVTLDVPEQRGQRNLPLNISVVIDRSGSMEDKGKLVYAKEAASTFVRKLAEGDRLSIVEYDDKISLLVEPVLMGKERGAIVEKIGGLTPRGSTDLAGGMVKGGDQVERHFDEKRINRVLLLSDGLANVGVSDIPGVSKLAESINLKGIQVTTFGLGADFDEEMMTRIADAAGGNYYFIEGPAQIAEIFEKERRALSTVVAKGARVTLEVSAEMKLDEVVGYPSEEKGGKTFIKLPDLYSGQKRKILFKLLPRKIKGSEDEEITLAHVGLHYDIVGDNVVSREMSQAVKAKITSSRQTFESSARNEVLIESIKIASARQLEDAMKVYQGGDSPRATSILDQARGALEQLYQKTQSPALLEQMKVLERARSDVQSLPPSSEAGKLFIKGQKSEAREQQREY